MYRVWYWLDGVLQMVSCGKWAGYAVRVLIGYAHPPSYYPWLEYIADPKRR